MGRKSTLRHRRSRRDSASVGYGRLLRVPFVVMKSLGRRAFRWLLLRQQRFMHARSSSDVEATLRNLKIELERSYRTQPSPRLRPPHHLRPRPLSSAWKVYVPRRRLRKGNASFLLKKGHYQVPKRGRPVPVSPDIVKYLTLEGVRKTSFQCANNAGMPAYLCFSNEGNVRDEQSSFSGYSSAEETLSEHSVYGNQSKKSASTKVSFSPDIECSTDYSNDDADSRRSSLNIDESSSFATSEKISPKLMEVVASLRARASSSLSTNLEVNNLNKRSSTQRRPSDHGDSFGSQASRSSYQKNITGSSRNISYNRLSCRETTVIANFQCLSGKSSNNLTVCSDSDNESGVNFMKVQEKNYRKSMLRLSESSSINENSLYDSSEPFYDVILDSGYSTVVESSQESVRSCSTDSCQTSRVSEKYGGASITPENSMNSLSRSLSSLKIDHEAKISLGINEIQIHDQGDGIPWKTQSAEELSVCKLVPSALFSCNDEQSSVTPTTSPEPQKSFLHNVVNLGPVSVTARRMLPPLPDSSLPPIPSSSSNATRILPSELVQLPTDVQTSIPQSCVVSDSPHACDALLAPNTSSSEALESASTSLLLGSSNLNTPTTTHTSVLCSPSSSLLAGLNSTRSSQLCVPVACEVGSSIFYLPSNEYSNSLATENENQKADEGSGESRGAFLPPNKVFPSVASKPTVAPATSGSASSLSFTSPVPAFKKESQLPPLSSRSAVTPPKPLRLGSSSKPIAKAPMTNTGVKSPNVAHHPGSESLNAALRNHQSFAKKGNDHLPIPSSLSGGMSPTPLHLPSIANKKHALVPPNRNSDPSASASKSTPSTSVSSTGANAVLRRPQPTGGVQVFALGSVSGTPDTTEEVEDPDDSQESVRLSDGSRVDLTPLYKSLVQRDFFHLVSRQRAEEMLTESKTHCILTESMTSCILTESKTHCILTESNALTNSSHSALKNTMNWFSSLWTSWLSTICKSH
ncbi:hypothetical protein FHG87_006106 [Trinorchestia longiramus]|nr:hypothetical protein FHG87_006106 [Trinorchestia longiramus]